MATQTYQYRALDGRGGEVSGVLEASNEKDAFNKLSAKNLSPYELKIKVEKTDIWFFKTKLSREDLNRYLRQLATLLSANVTVMEALTTLSRSKANPLIAERSQQILSDLRAGKKLSASIEARLPELPNYVFRLSDLGEATGSLASALSDAADRMEYEQQVRSDVRSAMTYPAFLMGIGSIIVLLMFVFVVPRFATLLGDDFSNAPWLSRTVINAGLWMKTNLVILTGFLAALVISGVGAGRNEVFRMKFRSFAEALPLVGSMLKKTELAGWCRTVGIAILNKAQLVEALHLGEMGVQSLVFRGQLERARAMVRAGRPLEEALVEADPDFDAMILDLIRTGRNSGSLGEMLSFSADLYEKEAREKTGQVTALAEPMAIVGIALVVGVIVISIVLAMTSVYDFDF